jgi:hypothetical protein
MATATKQTQEQRGRDINTREGSSRSDDASNSKSDRINIESERMTTSDQENESVEVGSTSKQVQYSNADMTLSFRMSISLDPSKRYPTNA